VLGNGVFEIKYWGRGQRRTCAVDGRRGHSLNSGTDATKGAADLVLLQDDLPVIVDGIKEGRRTFANINRYLLYTMVSNFANVMLI
jgi:magnesium-transporting ATPase (P-type)